MNALCPASCIEILFACPACMEIGVASMRYAKSYAVSLIVFVDADVDECGEGSHDCSQICVNTPGSYYCNCQRGFQLVNDTHCEGICVFVCVTTCIRLTRADVDECEVLSPNGFCSQVCVDTEGSFHCDCMEGYQLFRSFLCTGLYCTY